MGPIYIARAALRDHRVYLDARMSSPWAPLRHRPYAILWTATLLANVGVWMYSAAAGWLMTSLDPDPLMVSLVQAAATLPMFLFALPAGALADIVDTRRYLIATETGVILCAIPLAWLVGQDAMTPVLLLLFTFLIESAAALAAPAWQSIVPRLVPRVDLGAAIAANSMEVNISRAVGPALGGVIGAAFGAAAPFWVNAFSNVGSIAALLGMRHAPTRTHGLPAERLAGAIRAGMRHARGNPPLRATLKRAALFFFLASAYWGLLPLVVRDRLGGGGDLYGWMLGTIGVGAVSAVFVLPALERAIGHERLVSVAQVGTALSMAIFAFATHPGPAFAGSLLAGASWIAGVSRLNVSAQLSLPDWVRARGLALHVALTFGAMTLGSVAWGQLARAAGLVPALYAAASVALILVPLAARWKLGAGSGLDLSPSMHWPAPIVREGIEDDEGPVMVAVQYQVAQSSRGAFLAAGEELERQRERSGAYGWEMFEDAGHPGRFVETFYAESWLEHLRQHERVTVADRTAEVRVRALVESEPIVTHLVAAKRD